MIYRVDQVIILVMSVMLLGVMVLMLIKIAGY